MRTVVAVVASVVLIVGGCASTSARYAKPGFYTEVKDGRLWVLREGSKELEAFKKQGELDHQVTRVGAGPEGMTIKSSDAKVIDEYLAAR